jgi:plastocyanin
MDRARSRRALLAGLGAAGLASLSGCTGRTRRQRRDPPPGDVTVRMTSDRRFEPEQTTIDAGDTVVWVNDGKRMQSVTAYEEQVPSLRAYFASGGFQREISARVAYPLKGGVRSEGWYSHAFHTPGTYGYFSIPSESNGMTGTIVVEA